MIWNECSLDPYLFNIPECPAICPKFVRGNHHQRRQSGARKVCCRTQLHPRCLSCFFSWPGSLKSFNYVCVCVFFSPGMMGPNIPNDLSPCKMNAGISPVRFGQWPTPGPGGTGPTLAIQLADRIQEARPTPCYLSTKMLVDSLPIVGYTGYKLWSSVMGIQCLNTKMQILAILGAIPPMYCVCNWPIPIWMGQIVGKGWEIDSSWLPIGISMDSRFSNIGPLSLGLELAKSGAGPEIGFWSRERGFYLQQVRGFSWFFLLSLQPGTYWDYILGVPKAYVL